MLSPSIVFFLTPAFPKAHRNLRFLYFKYPDFFYNNHIKCIIYSYMNNVHLHIIGSKFFPILLNELDFNYTISSDVNLKYNHKDLLIRVIFVENLKQIEIKKYFNENIPTIFFFK